MLDKESLLTTENKAGIADTKAICWRKGYGSVLRGHLRHTSGATELSCAYRQWMMKGGGLTLMWGLQEERGHIDTRMLLRYPEGEKKE